MSLWHDFDRWRCNQGIAQDNEAIPLLRSAWLIAWRGGFRERDDEVAGLLQTIASCDELIALGRKERDSLREKYEWSTTSKNAGD